MPIPDERLPEFDDSDEGAGSYESEGLQQDDELEFESADADTATDDMREPDKSTDAGFGYGDPAD